MPSTRWTGNSPRSRTSPTDNPHEQVRIAALRPLIQAKRDELAGRIDSRRTKGLQATADIYGKGRDRL